jgi:hypothetical protein
MNGLYAYNTTAVEIRSIDKEWTRIMLAKKLLNYFGRTLCVRA